MKKWISKRHSMVLLSGFVLALIIGLSCSLLLRNLGNIIEVFGEILGLGTDTVTYVQILSQLKTAEIDLPACMLLLLSIVFIIGMSRLLCGRKGKVNSKKSKILRGVTAVPAACIGLILIMLITLWFTDVNGIRFGTAISFLYNAVQSGVF